MNIFDKIKPIFDEVNYCIVFSANNDFVPCLSVMIQSIIDNSVNNKEYDILVLNKDILPLSQKVFNDMVAGYNNISIRFINVTKYIEGIRFYTENRENITEEAYYRLLIPWVLDESYVRALYLDGDMVALTDVTKIFDIDLKENIIAAVRDYWGICNCYIPNDTMRGYRESIGVRNIDDYVISATVLFDLKKFREFISLREVFDMVMLKQWKQHDQDVINVLLQGHILYLSPIWGYMSDYGNNKYLPIYLYEELESSKSHINIVHFGGARKPWSKLYVENFMLFWRYAYRTPYFTTLLNKVGFLEYRSFIANKLSNGDIEKHYTASGINLSFKGVNLGCYENMIARYQKVDIVNNKLHLEGMVGFYCVPSHSKIKIFVEINGVRVPVDKQACSDGYTDDGELIYRGEYFAIDFQLDMNNVYEFKIVSELDGNLLYAPNVVCERYFPIDDRLKDSYYEKENWILKKDKGVLYLRVTDNVLTYEKLFLKELYKNGNKENVKAVFGRIICWFLNKMKRKPIWLISDRLSKADDNGEAFFKYLNSFDSGVDSYFVISDKCSDYKHLKNFGNVIVAYSWKHKILQLIADVVASSQTDEVFRNPFWGNYRFYKDYLNKTKFVFLQHGIISTDLSGWLRRRKQYIAGFVTSAGKERDLILTGDYNYCEEEVWLTGLPRFDYLKDCREKLITIQPTWRKYLAIAQNHKTGVWEMVPNFSESKYATFFRTLLTDESLNDAAKKYGYRIQFKVHPSFLSKVSEFKFPENVSIVDDAISYREIYERSSLLVTDYSSSVYDFLYLRKPIVYCQFDKEEFFSGEHMSTLTDFDYEKDGFGEVEYDLESTVNRIIEYMKTDCQLKDKYRERIDGFFAYNDKNNCKRVYDAIKSLGK